MADKHDRRRTEISGREARQGEIILRTPLRKAIFIAGLIGFVLLAALTTCVPLP